MKSWLGDQCRTAWAFLYWNARKTVFVAGRRRGPCPCHHPSDSGRPLETGCEAVLGWAQPQRFRRVCPLLGRSPAGAWVCSAAPAAVRPFWGRAVTWYGGSAAAALLLAGLVVFGTMRLIGYHVSLRQVFWPRAWSELREVRMQLFLEQARAHYQAGRVRDAVNALAVAYDQAPDNFPVGMLLAQLYQTGNPEMSDQIFLHLTKVHPEKRGEVARAWFASLLARNRLADVAELAMRQLPTDPAQAGVWTNAVVFAARELGRPELLEKAAALAGVSAEARAVLEFEARIRRLAPGAARAAVLSEPWVRGFPYALVQRADLLTEFGQPQQALQLLAASRLELGGRDLVRLALRAYAAAGDAASVQRETGAMLAPGRKLGAGELTLVAQHLVGHPDGVVLARLREALPRVADLPVPERREVYLDALCAAGAAGHRAAFDQLAGLAHGQQLVSRVATDWLGEFFFGNARRRQPVGVLLPLLQPASLELNYAMLERYGRAAAPAAKP